ncbi:sensor histidine kinase [Streptomyces albireticuli]|uniref:histidine kinase n=1 Tax=Streptomyces albireticuli TaxID=1940 RepID=A0A2A2DGJ1_9ACTN|nr:histidine kinase [Streptomyces albireticuli]MCD9145657.1 histidine kinase [Streptomyces albireticuli]MCD9165611.1 histidine kinase [Streptomyces albireticuli]MCD9196334.1 histidine kinase [Streptomyces albireticuli]PAU50567.1 two-component sensor histidine kinase [Streptomyces albireticuli]
MRQLGSWVARVGVGFVRSCVVGSLSMLVPLVWAGAVALGIRWGAANPWSWLAPLVLVCTGTLALCRTVCRAVRFLVGKWTDTAVPAGYRQAPAVSQLSTGHWWNGFSYERTRRDALRDQKWRLWWYDPATWRDLRFTALLPFTAGALACFPPAAVAAGLLTLARPEPAARLVGILALAAALATAPYAWRAVRPVAVRFLRPSPAMVLADRVEELTAQRADVTVAQAAEIRRIERDLHDGAQARLVGLGLSLATAERLMETDPGRARALMRDARAGAATSLSELRELVRGINPPVLSDRGLVDAVRALALDSPLETTVSAGAEVRLEVPVESALYFAVAELLTNAAKHAHATRAAVSLVWGGTGVVVAVEDDGRGGAAERDGGGLAGLRRRLSVFDGTLEITSPVGGPTRVRMMVPCE